MRISTCQACGGPKCIDTHCGAYCIKCSIEYQNHDTFCQDVEYCELCAELEEMEKEKLLLSVKGLNNL